MTVDDPITEDDIKEILHDFQVDNDLENAEIIYEDGSNLGDGYLGVTKAITVKKGGTIFDLFVKAAPKDEKLREILSTHMEQRGEDFTNLCQIVGDSILFLFEHFNFKTILYTALDVLKEHGDGRIDRSTLGKVEESIENFYELVEETVNCDYNHGILIHGDCWMNNMQFKYDEHTKRPVDLRLVDFQVIRRTLPVMDLAYFFYCSAITQENLDKLDFYLDYYYDNLNDYVKKLGSNLAKIYPYEIFKDNWRRYCKYGIMMSLCISRIVLAQSGETLNVAEKVRTDPEEARKALFTVNLSNNDEYIERMSRVLKHAVKNKYL
ncbi:Ecdysteroid kinase-like family [Popillia japonica]|uniref:Ecdysteroid kinase-like family n=1 Tax=Popillia japonica TaxID=7064 RepID=A0AAW1KJJ5_POPJA